MLSIYIWVIIDIALFNLVALPVFLNAKIANGKVKVNFGKSRESITLYFLLLLFFCLFDKSSGDYFHYEKMISEMAKYHSWEPGLEDIYNYIIELTGYSYLLFRLIIWGASLLLFYFIMRVLGLNLPLSYPIFAIVLLRYFSYGRYSLAISFFLFGIILWRYKKKWLVGFALIGLSVVFHKSMLIICPVLLLLFLPLNKKMIIVLAIIEYVALSYLGTRYTELIELFNNGENVREFQHMSAEREYDNSIRDMIMFYSFFLPILYFLYRFWKQRKSLKTPCIYTDLLKLVVGIFFLSSALYFLNLGSASLYIRTRNLAFFPAFLIIAYYVSMNKTRLSLKYFYGFLILYLSDMMYYFYMFYLKTIGLGV